MEPAQHVFADNLAIANLWYTALFGFLPTEEPYGLRYQLGGESFVLSPTGNKGLCGLRLLSVEQARQRLARLTPDPKEVLGTAHGYEEGETTTFQDPFGNTLIVVDLANQ